jgi:hypothetical protein
VARNQKIQKLEHALTATLYAFTLKRHDKNALFSRYKKSGKSIIFMVKFCC